MGLRTSPHRLPNYQSCYGRTSHVLATVKRSWPLRPGPNPYTYQITSVYHGPSIPFRMPYVQAYHSRVSTSSWFRTARVRTCPRVMDRVGSRFPILRPRHGKMWTCPVPGKSWPWSAIRRRSYEARTKYVEEDRYPSFHQGASCRTFLGTTKPQDRSCRDSLIVRICPLNYRRC